MHLLEKKALGLARKVYSRLAPSDAGPAAPPMIEGQPASDLIRGALGRPEPFLVARFGSTELAVTNIFLQRNRKWRHRVANYLRAGIPVDYDERTRQGIANSSGVFPVDDDALDAFVRTYLDATGEVDVLGRFGWADEDVVSHRFCPRAASIHAPDIEPYYHAEPWSVCLHDRSVLVIHPFEESIRRQYEKRELLFENADVLPRFRLITFKPVVSLAGEPTEHPSWTAALDWMCERIRGIDFDVALVGAGAYGLPLAAFVKRLGRQAVHMGGALQVLFGIRGRRWDHHPFISELYNEYWVRPLASERPRDLSRLQDDCGYW